MENSFFRASFSFVVVLCIANQAKNECKPTSVEGIHFIVTFSKLVLTRY